MKEVSHKNILILKAFGNQFMMQVAIQHFYFSFTIYFTHREEQLLAEQ